MKQVLIIDASPLFQEYLRDKLVAEQVEVETARGDRDAYTKAITTLPDLIIIDIESDFKNLYDFLQGKYRDPNARRIPIIISGPSIPRNQVSNLIQFGVVKYFAKPIKFDVFFESVSKILKVVLTMDDTPCVLETHLNGNLIFIEIAQGLNREKISLLKYKLNDLITRNDMHEPKVIIMMTNLELTFMDGTNLELLINNVLASSHIKAENVKILSFDKFTHDLIEGHTSYKHIEVVESMSEILNSVVDVGVSTDVTELVAEKVLASDVEVEDSSIETRFLADTGSSADSMDAIKVAIVDDDVVTLKLLKSTFATLEAEAYLFPTGAEFLASIQKMVYDIIILDIYIPDIYGYDILKELKARNIQTPILIYSQATNREAVVQTLSLGAKSYLVKPQKPDVIVKKAIEVLNG